jgi:hypothetical protein
MMTVKGDRPPGVFRHGDTVLVTAPLFRGSAGKVSRLRRGTDVGVDVCDGFTVWYGREDLHLLQPANPPTTDTQRRQHRQDMAGHWRERGLLTA